MLSIKDFRQDQLDEVAWLRSRTEAMELQPVGFGKTIVTLRALHEQFQCTGKRRVLIVSTKAIVTKTWSAEFRDWDFLGEYTYAAAASPGKKSMTAAQRKRIIYSKPDFLGINFENLESFLDLVDEDRTLLPEILIIDESSKMKDQNANRVKRLIGKRTPTKRRGERYVDYFERRYLLSATPNPEGYAGLWPQHECMSSKQRIGHNITNFRERYCSAMPGGSYVKWSTTKTGREEIHEALKYVCRAPRTMDYLDIPDPIHTEISVPWSPEARDEYDALEEDFLLDLTDKLEAVAEPEARENVNIVDLIENPELTRTIAPNMGVLFSKLRQACSGFVYDTKSNARLLTDSDAKLDALDNFRDRCGDNPLVLFTQYTAEADMIAHRFKDAHIGLPEDLDVWNKDRAIPLLVLHPRSAGHGINLPYGGHIAAWYSLPWSYEEWHQANGRLQRTGQEDQVTIARFMRPDSIEQNVWQKLHRKQSTLSQFVAAIQARHHGV